MTTFQRSRRDDLVLVGFFVLVGVLIGWRADDAVISTLGFVVAVALVGLGLWLTLRPSLELRISHTEIVLASSRGPIGRLDRSATDGLVTVHRRIHRGRAYVDLRAASIDDGAHLPLDGFRVPVGELAAACTEHGWTLVGVGS